MLAAVAVAALLVLWLTTGQGGGGKPAATAHPAPAPSVPTSITPGATPTGPAITSHPGGTGGTSGGAAGGTAGGTAAGASGGSGGTTGGTGTDTTGSGSTGGDSSSSGGSGGGSAGGAPPVNTSDVMALPVCTASQLTLELAGTQNAYQAKDKPTFELKVRNASGSPCRVDLSQAAAAITVNSASGERIWSSADCVTDKQGRWVQITPATALTETFIWDRTRSKPQCPTPTDTTPAPAGNYLVQAELTGPPGGPVPARTSTRLDP